MKITKLSYFNVKTQRNKVAKNKNRHYDFVMFEEFLAQMLVLFMCVLSGIRVFFIKNERVDCFAIPAPIAFFTSLLIFPAFGLSLQTIAVSAVALIFALTNIRSCMRIFSKLIVDRYSALFIITTVVELLVALFLAAGLVYFSPIKTEPEKFGVKKTSYRLAGNATTHFQIVANKFHNSKKNTTGFLNIYEPSEQNPDFEKNPVLLFVAGPHGTVQDYEPYLLFLSQEGFKILAADFYSPDMPVFDSDKDSWYFRKFFARKEYIDAKKNKSDSFKKIDEKITQNKIKGYTELLRLSSSIFGEQKIFLIVDQMSFDSISPIINQDKDRIFGFFPMNRIPEYKTTGLGFINQTNPFFAYMLGFKRDKALFMPRYVAQKAAQDVLLYSGLK